jgi:hypothetical protein
LRQPSVAETAGFLLKSTALNRPNEDTNDPRYEMAGQHPRRGYLHGMLGCFFQSRTLNSSSEPRRVPEVSAGPIRRALQGRSPTAKMTQRRIPITPEIVICGGVPEHWEKSRELDLRLTDDATIPSSLPNSSTEHVLDVRFFLLRVGVHRKQTTVCRRLAFTALQPSF